MIKFSDRLNRFISLRIGIKDFFVQILCMAMGAFFSCSVPNADEQANDGDTSSTGTFSEINEKIKEDPGNADLYFQRAKMHLDAKDLESSYKDAGRALKLDSSQADFYLLMADIHFIKKEGIKAKDILSRCLEIDPSNTDAYLKLGEIYFLVEQYGKSIEHINLALKTDAHNAKAYFMKGMNYKYSGDTARAISSMQTAVEQDNEYYDAYIQLALLYSAMHDSLAISYFDNALRIDTKSAEAEYGKSLFLQEHGQPERSLQGYERIIGYDTEYAPLALFNMGYVYLAHLEKYKEAEDYFTRAIEKNPSYFEAWCNRGIAREKMKNLKLAEADFRKALQIRADYTPAAKGISRVVDKDFD